MENQPETEPAPLLLWKKSIEGVLHLDRVKLLGEPETPCKTSDVSVDGESG